MGNPPPRKKQPTVHKPLVIKPAPPTPQEIAKKEAEEKEIEKHKNDLLALSPFLEWVRQNKEKAVEIAQESAQQYKKEAPKPSDDDLFLSIRFPYKGTEPSGNSVAIYSTPEK